MHLDAGEFGQNVRHVLQRRPVELQVLPRGEMAIAAIIFARDLGELAQLARRQRAIGHGDAQHIGVQLQIEPVHQPMRPELLLGQFAGDAALDLVAELARRAPRRRRRRIRHSDTWELSTAGALTKAGAWPCACLPRSRRIVGPVARIEFAQRLGRDNGRCAFRRRWHRRRRRCRALRPVWRSASAALVASARHRPRRGRNPRPSRARPEKRQCRQSGDWR